MVNFLDITKKMETGEICSWKEFIGKRYWAKVNELVKEYDIKFDPENIVPTDNSLINDAFNAGLKLLLGVGFFCTDTNRIIKFEEEEVEEALKNQPGEGILGTGRDRVTLRHLEPEDERVPVNLGGSTGVFLSEHLAMKIYQSYAQEPTLDILFLGTPLTFQGMDIKGSNSPLELIAEMHNISLARSATSAVGRPGLPLYGSLLPSLATELNASNEEYGYRKTELRPVWPLPNLAVNYQTLTRAAHFARYGCHCCTAGAAHIGGLTGGPETSVITAIGECIGTTILFQPLINTTEVMNIMYAPYGSDSDKMSMWGCCLGTAAMDKNTNSILSHTCYTVAGPCTEMCLEEISAHVISGAAVGASLVYGPAPNSGLQRDHCTGMEARFGGEVSRAAAGIKAKDANEIVKTLIDKSENLIKSRKIPLGKSFDECYDINTITPSKEYIEIYEKVKKQLENFGLQFKY